MGDLTRNFSKSEFASPDGAAMPSKYDANLLELARQLQRLRVALGKPFAIHSGYRSPARNRAVGGAANSRHLTAQAADFSVAGATLAEVYCVAERLIKAGKMKQGGLGIYPSHLHYDTRGTKARWNEDVTVPSCPPGATPEPQEVEAMAFAFKVAGRGTTVFVDTGTDIRRVTSGAALGRMKKHGIVLNKPAPTITQDEYGKLLKDRQQN